LKIEKIREFALSLPGVTEEPHFQFSSFRVKGKIFVTVPPDGNLLHVFVDEPQRELMVSAQPEAYEKLWWGKKVVGLRIHMSKAKAKDVEELVHSAWLRKAPKSSRDAKR
jgi:hypothetical protein